MSVKKLLTNVSNYRINVSNLRINVGLKNDRENYLTYHYSIDLTHILNLEANEKATSAAGESDEVSESHSWDGPKRLTEIGLNRMEFNQWFNLIKTD